ncbi:MAG: hypothetical protein HZB92_01260 [Euryarchaeota archaeon]|nr:hypothetical protein [Euryarchaeota archaeon]
MEKVRADEVQADIIGATRANSLGYNGTGFLIGDAGLGLDTGNNATLFADFGSRVRFWVDWVEADSSDGVAEDGYGLGTPFLTWMVGNGANGTVDPVDGKLYGEGIAPNANIVVERVFGDTGNWFGGNILDVWRDASQKGAYGLYNPWGGGTINNYEAMSYNIDVATRDADNTKSGDQPLLLLMAGGNSDLTATGCNKNGITVGMSEGYKPHKSVSADNINEWVTASADGPTADGRIKPDFVAPSTWGAGVRSHSPTATATGEQIISNDYLYASGTGGSAAMACGAATLFADYYNRTNGARPSPAMVKAALVNGATDMDDAVNTPPIPNGREGWGRINLTNVIAPDFKVFYDDQSSPLADNTQKVYSNISVTDDTKPFKVSLVWTDVPAPNATGAGRALINDLNLTVISPGGTEYHGNQFTNGWSNSSMTGYDTANNVECVYVQTPQLGIWAIRINADDIRSDAVSGTPQVDQDYALVVSGKVGVDGGPVVTNAYADPNPTNGAATSMLIADISGLSNITNAEYFIDATGANGTGFAMTPTDGLFNSTSEKAFATIDIAALGWLPGESHTLYVHARDNASKWGEYYDVILYVGTGYYLHVETSLGTNMSLLKVLPDETSVITNTTGDMGTAGQYRVGNAAWISEPYGNPTQIGGTWRYIAYGMVNTKDASGFMYAKVFKYGTMTQLNPAPTQCSTNVSGKYSYYRFEWTETIPNNTISAGDWIYVEIWLNATKGDGGSGVTQYTFAGVTQASGPHDAYFCDVDDNSQAELTTPNSMTELTDGEYVAISTSNDVRATSADPGAQDEIFARYRFQISESPNYITGITLTHEALYSAAVTCTMYAYNYATSLWTQVGTTQSFGAGAEATMTRSIASNYADYISTAGGLNWGVYASARATCSLDCARADIAYSIPYPTFVLGYDNNTASSLIVVPETIATVIPPFCNITVQLGWNLISVPLVGPTVLPGALMDIADGGGGLVQWDRVMWYDPGTPANLWKQYYTVWNAGLNDLTVVNHTIGVWLNVTNVGDGQICLGGSGYANNTNATIPLSQGWNLIGYPARDDSTYPVGQLISATGATLVEGFNATATYRTSPLVASYVMKRGQAYWVYCPSATTWWVNW